MIAPNSTTSFQGLTVHVLHLEDSDADHALVARALRRDLPGCRLDRVDTLADFQSRLHSSTYDVILADYRLAGFTALQAWDYVRSRQVSTPFILVSGAIGESAAVEAIHSGMSDYVSKGELQRLGRVVQRALAIEAARTSEARALAELASSERRLAALADHLQTAIESERAAIAREIHDDIGGALAAVRLDLAWISRHSKGPDLHSHIGAAEEMLQHALGASQRIMMDLRPAILDQGLVAALQWLAAGFERRTGARVRWTSAVNEATVFGKGIQLTAYRTAQEAFTNISKYAKCKNVLVDLSDSEGVLTLEIQDDGKGIQDVDLENPTAFGLRGLRERAKAAGGWLDISSQPGKGTAIILSIPLDDSPKPATQGDFA